MKISPEDLILKEDLILESNLYYVSGNDETYIKKIESIIIKKLKKNGFGAHRRLEGAAEYSGKSNLFFESEIIVIDNINGVDEAFINRIENNGDALIISAKNKQGDSVLKKTFMNGKNLSILLCYELSRDLKARLLNFYKNNKNLNMDKDAYWHLLDTTDNRFVFFDQEIQKLLLVDKKNIDISLINKTLSIQENKSFEKLFFALQLKNKNIIETYNALISTHSDLQFFFQRARFFLEIIMSSDSSKEAEQRFPKYLFKEKSNFLNIYKKVSKQSLKKIISLLYEAEKTTRKNNALFKPIGLIFVLRLKKIIFSA